MVVIIVRSCFSKLCNRLIVYPEISANTSDPAEKVSNNVVVFLQIHFPGMLAEDRPNKS